MTAYTEARKRGDTQAQHRAAERAKRETHAALIAELKAERILSGKKAARIRRALA